MNADDLERIKANIDVPWDDVKEQRVLTRVLAERRAPVSTWKKGAIPAAVATLAVAAAVTLVPWKRVLSQDPNEARTAEVRAPAESEQTMALADGSQAFLVRDATLQVEEQRADLVRIVQRRGTVRYEVRPDPKREFTVRVAGNVVRVRGTVFTVARAQESVEVSVQRGRVEVDDGGRKRELAPGESLRVPIRNGADDIPLVPASAAPPPDIAPSALPSTEAEPRPTSTSRASAADLLAKADAARLAQKPAEAAAALETLVATYPRDSRVPNALFSLARVERSRGRETAAAKAFERCLKVAPKGALAEDALAEAAVSWSLVGMDQAARQHATSYLSRYPQGPHAKRMKAIIDP